MGRAAGSVLTTWPFRSTSRGIGGGEWEVWGNKKNVCSLRTTERKMGSEGLKSGVEFQIQHCWTKSQKLGEPEKYKEM